MPGSDWRKKTAWKLDGAEQHLDVQFGCHRQRVRARSDLVAEPSAVSSCSPGGCLDYPDFPDGVPGTPSQELQAMRMGHTVPANFEPQRYIWMVAGRPVMATACFTAGVFITKRSCGHELYSFLVRIFLRR